MVNPATQTRAATTPCPTTPGMPYAGGYYVGLLRMPSQLHAIIVAPKAGGELRGAWHPDLADVPGARSTVDGLANTRAMAEAGSDLARQALACRLGGFDDWHIPARDALELMYRHLKPTTEKNYCTTGDGKNASSEPPGQLYTKATPEQTGAPAFRSSAREALDPVWHWSSTQTSRHYAYFQDFGDGLTNAGSEDWTDGVVRLVRSIPLEQFDLQHLRREAPSEIFATAAPCACSGCDLHAPALAAALDTLLTTCSGMDHADHSQRPTEAAYQAALGFGRAALALHHARQA